MSEDQSQPLPVKLEFLTDDEALRSFASRYWDARREPHRTMFFRDRVADLCAEIGIRQHEAVSKLEQIVVATFGECDTCGCGIQVRSRHDLRLFIGGSYRSVCPACYALEGQTVVKAKVAAAVKSRPYPGILNLHDLSPVEQQRLVHTMFYHMGWFQQDGTLRASENPYFDKISNMYARLFLRAWVDRLDILQRIGSMYGTTQYRVSAGGSDSVVEYLKENPVRPFQLCQATQTDLVYFSTKVGTYDVDFVLGRYEIAYLGPEHDECLRKQQAIAVQCNDKLDEEMTDDDRQRNRFVDEALQAHGLKVLRFTADELDTQSGWCARRVDEFFIPTLCMDRNGKSDHPYDRLMAAVLRETAT